MINPMSVVKNVRTVYDRFYQKMSRKLKCSLKMKTLHGFLMILYLAMMNFEGDILNG